MALNDSVGGASGKREVLSLLRRCMVEHTLTADIIDTSLEMLPSYDDAAIVEALVDIVENRIRPKFSSALRGSGGGGGTTFSRRSHRKAALEAVAAAGSFGGGTPPAGFGLSPATGSAPRSLAGSPSDGGGATPFGRSATDDTIVHVPMNAIDSAPHSEEDLSTLAAVLKMALVSMPSSVRDAIRDALLVLLVDRNAPTLFSRHNSALLLGALMAQQFFPGGASQSSSASWLPPSPPGAVDPLEMLFDTFARVEGGVSTPEQCSALLTILCTPVPPSSTTTTNGGGSGEGPCTILKRHAESPYRAKLYELITGGEAYRLAYDAKASANLHLHPASLSSASVGTAAGCTEQPCDALQSVWALLEVLASVDASRMAKKGGAALCCPPPMAIGATPPTNGGSGNVASSAPMHQQQQPPAPPSYTTSGTSCGGPPPPPPPSYTLHMSQRSQGSNASQSSSLQGSASFVGGQPTLSQQPAPPMAPVSDVSLEQHVAHQRLVLTMSQKEEAKVRTVYINKLDPRITEGQLRDFLDLCGQVLRVRLCGELVGRTKYGFVEYTTSEAARKLIQKDRDIVGNCAIRCSLAKQPIQDVDAQMDAVLDAKRGLTRACLFGFVARTTPSTTTSSVSAGFTSGGVHMAAASKSTESSHSGGGGPTRGGPTVASHRRDVLSGSGGCQSRGGGSEPSSIAT